MDLEQVDRITADAVGEPGSRTFYLQMRSGAEMVSVILEKQQLRLLASSIEELLGRLQRATDVASGAGEGLEEPLEPSWRVGRLSLGYHEDLDLVLLEVEELVPEGDEEEDEEEAGRGARGGDPVRRPSGGGRGRRRQAAVSVLRQPARSRGPQLSRDERPREPDG